MTPIRIYNLLRQTLAATSGHLGPLGLISHTQRWLRANKRSWDKRSWDAYALEELSTLNPRQYASSSDMVPIKEQIRSIQRVSHTTWPGVSAFARDLIWNIIAVESSVECPSCAQAQLRILQSKQNGTMVLECSQCGWGQNIDGSEAADTDCRPATFAAIESLRAAGAHRILPRHIQRMPEDDTLQQ